MDFLDQHDYIKGRLMRIVVMAIDPQAKPEDWTILEYMDSNSPKDLVTLGIDHEPMIVDGGKEPESSYRINFIFTWFLIPKEISYDSAIELAVYPCFSLRSGFLKDHDKPGLEAELRKMMVDRIHRTESFFVGALWRTKEWAAVKDKSTHLEFLREFRKAKIELEMIENDEDVPSID